MTRLQKIHLVLAIAAVFIALAQHRHLRSDDSQAIHALDTPMPTEDSDDDFKQQREAYFEALHRAAPGTDWRAMDHKNRKQLIEARAQKRQELINDGLDPQSKTVRFSKNGRTVTGTWSERGSNNLAGRMHAATIYNNTIFAGSAGGIVWSGTLDGQNWTPLNDWMVMKNIVSVEVVPEDGPGGQRIVVAHEGDHPVHFSNNEGQTWHVPIGFENLPTPVYTRRMEKLDDENQTLLVLVEDRSDSRYIGGMGLYKSVDQGESFQRIAFFDTDDRHTDFWSQPAAAGLSYIMADQSLYSFSLAGDVSLVADLPEEHYPSYVSRTHVRGRSTLNGPEVYVAVSKRGADTQIYGLTEDGTDVAYRGTVNAYTFKENSFEVSDKHDDELYLGSVNLYRSLDGGVNWDQVNYWYDYYTDSARYLHADLPGIQVFDQSDTELALISTDGGLYTSTDRLNTFTNISLQGQRTSQYYSVYTHRDNADLFWAGSQDQGFQRNHSAAAGLNDFEQLFNGDYAHIVSGDGGNSLWCVYPSFIMYMPQAADTSDRYRSYFSVYFQLWLPPLMADPHDPTVCWQGGGSTSDGAHLFRYTYENQGLTSEEGHHDFRNPITALAYSTVDPDTRYVTTSEGNVHVSLDGGTSWRISPAFEAPHGHRFSGAGIATSPVHAGTVWIAGSGYDNPPVYVSHDRGQTFAPMSEGLPSTLVYRLAVTDDGGTLFAATELGPYAWDQSNPGWQSLATPATPDQIYWCVDWVEATQTARFGTYGRGVWDFAIQTDTPDTPHASVDLVLHAAPNPFNPYSRVSFRLPQDADVRLEMYDLRGSKVATIFQGALAAGYHEKPLDGTKLASGVYLVRLIADNRSADLRVTLIK